MRISIIGRTNGLGPIIFWFASEVAHSFDNDRVAHPSLSASVRCLMIANKEGYFKKEGPSIEFLSLRGEIDGTSDEKLMLFLIDGMERATKAQREMKTKDAFDFSFARKVNEDIKASGWKP